MNPKSLSYDRKWIRRSGVGPAYRHDTIVQNHDTAVQKIITNPTAVRPS